MNGLAVLESGFETLERIEADATHLDNAHLLEASTCAKGVNSSTILEGACDTILMSLLDSVELHFCGAGVAAGAAKVVNEL